MSNYPEAPAEAAPPRLGMASALARFALIGVALAAVAGTFAYLGGWFMPNDLTPARFTDGFEQVNGVHPGFRRNHAKGLGASGFFESTGQGVRLSKAYVFQPGRAGDRPLLAGGWSALCGRHAGCGARSGASVFPVRRRTVANRDDQPAGVSIPYP